MPIKGFKKKRQNFINIAYHKRFIQQTGLDIDYKTMKNIIVESNREIANTILEGNDGFSIPLNMGLWVITSYEPNKKAIDWHNTLKYGKTIHHHNIGTFSKMIAINWYRINVKQLAFVSVYKFKACRKIKRAASKLFKGGLDYKHWSRSDYYDANRLERMLLKSNKRNTNGSDKS